MQHNVQKRKVLLRPLLESDFESIFNWHNDSDVTKYSLNSLIFPQTTEEVKEFIYKQKNDRLVTQGVLHLGKLVGYTGLSSINYINRSAEFFILIGEKTLWGKGIGYLAGTKMIQFGLLSLQLHRIELTVSEPNERAIHLYKKLNFTVEGIKKDACFRDGAYHNKVMMALITKQS